MTDTRTPLNRIALRESALLFGFLIFGLLILPVVIYLVGQQVFGSFGGDGYAGFFGALGRKLLTGDGYAWFLLMSPYLALQTLRLMRAGWRRAA